MDGVFQPDPSLLADWLVILPVVLSLWRRRPCC